MKTIWKFPFAPFNPAKAASIAMPRGAEILDVQLQNNTMCVWALVDPKAEPEIRKIACRGTGHECGDSIQAVNYITTLQVGSLVWHFFEVGE